MSPKQVNIGLLLAVLAIVLALALPDLLPPRRVPLLVPQLSPVAELYADGAANESHWLNRQNLHWLCRVIDPAKANLNCGFTLRFSPAQDFSGFYGLRFGLRVNSKARFLQVYMRNSVANYTQMGNPDTGQFNVLMVATEDFSQPVALEFREFAVADWWRSKHPVGSDYAYPRVDQVLSLGIDVPSAAAVGDHELQLEQLELLGHWVEPQRWYRWVMGVGAAFLLGAGALGLWWRRRALALERQIMAPLAEQNRERIAQQHAKRAQNHQDNLTGVLNRQGFASYWQALRTHWSASDELGLVIVDLDHLGRINETFGLAVGDKVLQQLVVVLMNQIRQSDKLARWGDDRFVVLCPLINLQGVLTQAEKLRAQISRISLEAHPDVQVTASLGVGTFRSDEAFETVFARVYQALMAAKTGGRNRVDAVQDDFT
jgi:diguanylate cyclase (GGDEF)-like protein